MVPVEQQKLPPKDITMILINPIQVHLGVWVEEVIIQITQIVQLETQDLVQIGQIHPHQQEAQIHLWVQDHITLVHLHHPVHQAHPLAWVDPPLAHLEQVE